MRVSELQELLEGMEPDAIVMMATQPMWPIEYEIDEVVEISPSDIEYGDDDPASDDDEEQVYVYLRQGDGDYMAEAKKGLIW